MDPISIILFVLLGISAVFLILLVLLQHDQGDGMAGLFGGSSNNQVGNRQGNILTKATTIFGAAFLILCVLIALNFMFQKVSNQIADKAAEDSAKAAKTASTWFESTPAPSVSPEASASPSASPSATGSPQASAIPSPSTKPSPSPKN